MNLSTQNAPATPKQLFALFCGTRLNTKGMHLTINKASNLISDMKNGVDITDELRTLGATGEAKKRPEDFQTLYTKAHNAGMEAAKNANVIPMTVVQHANPLNDNSPVVKSWYVPDGVCGFASIKFAGNTAFARWCIKNNLCCKSYPSGYRINVSQFGQSLQLKSAYAESFAKVLNEAGVKAYADSRLD